MQKYEVLAEKLKREQISAAEHKTLLKLVAKIEDAKAKKLELMLQLARLRNISLPVLAKDLEINVQ